MTWRAVIMCLLLACEQGLAGEPVWVPPQPDRPLQPNPDYHIRLAARHQATMVKVKDTKFIRFISFYEIRDDKELKKRTRLLTWWLNQMSFKQAPAYFYAVDGSDGRLFWLDLRDFGWNAGAWQAVAHRDIIFREPLCPSKETEYLRREAGLFQDQQTFHAEVIIPGPFLFRDTIETDRSPSYYDLLYAQFRFKPGKVKQKRIVVQIVEEQVAYNVPQQVFDPYQQKYVTVNTVAYKTVEKTKQVEKEIEVDGFVFADFPKDKDDWNKAFGLDEVAEFLKRQKIRITQGVITSGMTEDARKGSFVARQNRLLTFDMGPTGCSLQSFDVNKATGKQDYLEQSPKIARGLIDFDAQELLVGLPNGGQAAFLTNKVGKRLEVADNKVAQDSDQDDKRVRTPGSCVWCHAPANGVIPPENLVKEMLALGVDVKIKDRNQYQDFLGFYLGLERRLRSYTDPYAALIQDTTKEDYDDPKSKSWTGKEVADEFFRQRKDYDSAVTPQRAADILGVPLAIFNGVAVELPQARVQLLVRGKPCPRPTFDADIFPLLARKLVEDRDRILPPKLDFKEKK